MAYIKLVSAALVGGIIVSFALGVMSFGKVTNAKDFSESSNNKLNISNVDQTKSSESTKIKYPIKEIIVDLPRPTIVPTSTPTPTNTPVPTVTPSPPDPSPTDVPLSTESLVPTITPAPELDLDLEDEFYDFEKEFDSDLEPISSEDFGGDLDLQFASDFEDSFFTDSEIVLGVEAYNGEEYESESLDDRPPASGNNTQDSPLYTALISGLGLTTMLVLVRFFSPIK